MYSSSLSHEGFGQIGSYPNDSSTIRCHARKEPGEILRFLISLMKNYDKLRQQVEQKGGRVSDLQTITSLLDFKVKLGWGLSDDSVQLSRPEKLKHALYYVDNQIHLGVRQRPSRLPVYYLCRVYQDYWSEYSLIVDDLYMSPGYPITPDERFVSLMSGGHELYFLRLSQFREQIASNEEINIEEVKKLDLFLYDLGRYVFQAAWHDDQRLAIGVAESVDLPCFKEAIYLLYLILGGDLCELRSSTSPEMLEFFNKVYPNKAIFGLLKILPELDGADLAQMPNRTIHLYKKLTDAFRLFLNTEVTWGQGRNSLPLWRIIYANVTRLSHVKDELRQSGQLLKAREQLETVSNSVISRTLGISTVD